MIDWSLCRFRTIGLSMDVKRYWISRSLVGLTLLAIGVMIFARGTGVREIHQVSTPATSAKPLGNPEPSAEDWPWWRGSQRQNIVPSANVPTTWSVSENVEWQVPIPGRGHSSPCIWGMKIFLTTSDDEQKTISLLCLDKQTGQNLWTRELHRGGFPAIHKKNTHASSSSACDGQFIYVASTVNESCFVTSVDFDGTIQWQRAAGPYSSEWGYGSSPVLHQSLVIVSADNRGHAIDRLMGTSWIAGLDRQTGEIRWRVKRGEGDSFGTPLVANVAGRDQLLLAGKEAVCSYDPVTGDEIWKCRWGVKRTANTLTHDGERVYATARQPSAETVCIAANGTGDVTDTHIVWKDSKTACDVPSPLVHDGRLYIVTDEGVLNCVDSQTGKLRWKKRLGGNVSSSLLLVNGQLYSSNEDGKTFIIAIDQRGDIIAENVLPDGILATPVISGSRLFVRTTSSLFSITAPQGGAVANNPDGTNKKF